MATVETSVFADNLSLADTGILIEKWWASNERVEGYSQSSLFGTSCKFGKFAKLDVAFKSHIKTVSKSKYSS